MDATARFVAIVAVAAFVTERIVAVIDYLINAVRASRIPHAGGAEAPPREWRKLVFFFIAAIIAYVVVNVANLRLLNVLQVDKNVHPLVDFWLTWLVVVAGADRVRSMLGGGGGGSDDASQDRSDTPVVHLQIDGGEVRELKRVQ